MLYWDRKFLNKLKKLDITPHVYTRYLDNTLILIDVMKPGVRYKAGKLHWITDDDLIKKDIEIEEYARTFMILREIATSIDPDIQWEEDVPSAHPSGILPCLDMQLWYDRSSNKLYHQ